MARTNTRSKYSEETMGGRDKIDKMKECKADYDKISLDPLLIYVMSEMEKQGIRLSEPNMVVASWKMFPKKFSIFGWSQYPDSSRVSTGKWHLQDAKKKWITGDSNQYVITEKGRMAIRNAEELLDQGSGTLSSPRSPSNTRKQDKIIAYIRKTDAFKKYKKGKEITQFDLYDLLQCTLDSSGDALKENYDSLQVLAMEAKAEDIITFLNNIQKEFKEIKHG